MPNTGAGRRSRARLIARRALQVVLVVYCLLAGLAVVATLAGLLGPDSDPLAAAPMILLGMPWALALDLVAGDSVPLNFALVLISVLLNVAILIGVIRLIGKPRRRRTSVSI